MSYIYIHTGIPSVTERPIEIVERKGLGHPDTLADGIAEAVSMRYSRYCLEKFEVVLHHNVDKILIIGGQFKASFGMCEMVHPVRVVLNGRMSTSFANEQIDTRTIQEEAAKTYINTRLPLLDVKTHLIFEHFTNDYSRYGTWFRPRSFDDLPELKSKTASDTSIIVSYWPLTPLEQITLALERHFNASENLGKYKYLGQDIKVMAYRNGNSVLFTLCIPFLTKETPNPHFYFTKLDELIEELMQVANDTVKHDFDITIDINTQTVNPFLNKRYYMLGVGSCIECVEEGAVGRGNSPIGVISTNRPHSMEAPYGKNPIYHGGKVYSYFVTKIAKKIANEFLCECTVYALTRNSESLIPPPYLIIETSIDKIDKKKVEQLVEKILYNTDYIHDLVYGGVLMPY